MLHRLRPTHSVTFAVVELESQLAATQTGAASSAGAQSVAAEHQIVKAFQHMTRMKIEAVAGTPGSYSVAVLVSKHTKVTFTLTFSKGAAGTTVQYTPGTGTDRLPSFLHAAIEFDAPQAPMFMAKVLEGAFGSK